MMEIHHRSRNHSMRGQQVMAAASVVDDPDCQPMLLRLGMSVSDINAHTIDRVTYVEQIASTIVKLRLARG